ncbi:DUF4142 domain-containing protein [Palleronia sp.]|uniref:DUF4142 domain-containing protein n=1 Tax=Palleronia sp. TaxID=1940284 RepID=UPI0035C83C67
MRFIMASAALCALLSPLPVAAQSDNAPSDGTDVFRNDLPETHEAMDLPDLSADAASQVPDDLQQPFATASAGALAAQQYGNLTAAKYAGGAVRDLGDRMALLNQAINDRLNAVGDRAGQGSMTEDVRADLEVLADLNGAEFDRLFATWVTSVYPTIIDAWSQMGENETFAELSRAVTPKLEAQLATAQAVLDGDTGATQSGAAQANSGGNGDAGAQGQTNERQHTPKTEQPEVQSGENYAHEQVEVDPQSETASLPDDASQPDTAPAAGALDVVNPAIVFAMIADPSTELAQLEQAPEFPADQVHIVSLSEHLQESELSTLDTTLSDHHANLSRVRDAVNSHQGLYAAVSQSDGSVEDVVAFDVLDEGIVLYTRSGQQGQ